jgi:hypothetical membrane protein
MDERPSIPLDQFDDVGHEGASANRHIVAETPAGAGAASQGIPRWSAVAAGAAPVLLIGGFFGATALQPGSYNPVHDTISSLAAQGATDPWVMTTALTGVGMCYLLTALALEPAGRGGRIALASGGVATLLIATFHQPHHGYSFSHALAVIAASMSMCAWPALAAHRQHWAPLLTLPVGITAAAITIALTMWFAFEQHHTEVGLAERCAAAAAALWLYPVVITTRRAIIPREARENLQDKTE